MSKFGSVIGRELGQIAAQHLTLIVAACLLLIWLALVLRRKSKTSTPVTRQFKLGLLIGRELAQIVEGLRLLVPYLLAAFLLLTWITTELHDASGTKTPGMRLSAHVFIVAVLLCVILVADAVEVAYSLLRYKHLEQFSETTARLLKEMQDREDLVYEAREWLVTILIVIITLLLEFDDIYYPLTRTKIVLPQIPGFPPIPAGKLFSLLFATLPVLWMAQGPAKKIAREDPQKMLDQGSLVWWFIKTIGLVICCLGLDRPTKYIAGILTNDKKRMGLKPSDLAYYLSGLHRYGYSLHDVQTTIRIGMAGKCTINQRALYYAVSRLRNVFVRDFGFDSPPVSELGQTQIINLKAFKGPVIGEMQPTQEIEKTLKALDLDQISTFPPLPANLAITVTQDQNRPKALKYRIDTHGTIPADIDAYIILAEFESSWDDAAFDVRPEVTEHFDMRFECPCYRYRFAVTIDPACSITPSDLQAEAFVANIPHLGEQDRLQNSIEPIPSRTNATFALSYLLECPFPGITYRIGWTNRRAYALGDSSSFAAAKTRDSAPIETSLQIH